MSLPHYNNSKAAINKYEPITGNLFEVTILTPDNADAALILQHVTKIGGLNTIPSVEAIGQKFKWADRSYAGMPSQTYMDVSVDFSLNLNAANEAYIYKTLRDWYKRIHNPTTGQMSLKKDYVGTLIAVFYNRAGDIYRKVTCQDIFPIGEFGGMGDYEYTSSDPMALTLTFRCDHWVEELA
jgi:hypothetical protein